MPAVAHCERFRRFRVSSRVVLPQISKAATAEVIEDCLFGPREVQAELVRRIFMTNGLEAYLGVRLVMR